MQPTRPRLGSKLGRRRSPMLHEPPQGGDGKPWTQSRGVVWALAGGVLSLVFPVAHAGAAAGWWALDEVAPFVSSLLGLLGPFAAGRAAWGRYDASERIRRGWR